MANSSAPLFLALGIAASMFGFIEKGLRWRLPGMEYSGSSSLPLSGAAESFSWGGALSKPEAVLHFPLVSGYCLNLIEGVTGSGGFVRRGAG